MQIIDLTHTFTDNMPVFPGDKPPTLKHDYDKKNDILHYYVETGMHVGTHLDGPVHMIKDCRKLSEIDPERFIANGHVIDVRGNSKIDSDILEKTEIKEGDCVLFYTGRDKNFRDKKYFDGYPVITERLARKLVELKVKFIGTDTSSPDTDPYTVHRILLKEEILILENLTNLESLLGINKFEIIALPLKFDAEAAPVRVIAKIN